ncbi:uncharacterized protein [Leptinotarsa decemlineata]|uniref:uncharacterized protein n=1 Tax=Leptinotarsa decemlineata TaxID=7539 RepID=UPI003D304890
MYSKITATDDCERIIERKLEFVGDEVVFETNIKCETEMVGESAKYEMSDSEIVTHNLEEKYDIDQIKSEHVIDVYHEPKSEKCIEEISEGPQNKFLEIQEQLQSSMSKPIQEDVMSSSTHRNELSQINGPLKYRCNDRRRSKLYESMLSEYNFCLPCQRRDSRFYRERLRNERDLKNQLKRQELATSLSEIPKVLFVLWDDICMQYPY